MKKIMGGVVMLCMFACSVNSFGMHTENTKRVIEYLSFRAGLETKKRLQRFDEQEPVINTNIYAQLKPHVCFGFGPRNGIGSTENLAYLSGLVCQGLMSEPVRMLMLKEKLDIKHKDKMSVWKMKRKKVHMGRMGERKFQLMKEK